MLNNVILVGRVAKEPELTVYESGAHSSNVLLAVVRPFRNENNEYETDFIPIFVWHKMADNICDYVGTGSILGFKCRLATHRFDIEGRRLVMVDVIAERVSFIHLKPRTDKNKETEEEAIERELRKGNFVEYDSDDLSDRLDDVFVGEDMDGLYDDVEEIKNEKAEKGKKKAK